MAQPSGSATLRDAVRLATERLREAGIDDARIEAELLLMHATGLGRERLFAEMHAPLAPDVGGELEALLARRLAREPSAYITGHKEFYGLDLLCSPAALIPRPETELLVELALDFLRSSPKSRDPGPIAIDLGTGNGAIAVALAANAPGLRVVAIDASREALQLARENARRHAVEGRIDFVQADLLSPMRGPADVIVANLPYIPTPEYVALPPEIREQEPEVALHAGPAGTELIERLLAQAPAVLAPVGLLLIEHGWSQGERLRAAGSASFPDARIETRRDLAGIERVLVVSG
jgi:release factor glutamine methyltransferase